MSERAFKYVNDSVKIDFSVPNALRELMDEAERADLDDTGEYDNLADTIDVFAKNYCTDGLITKKQWDTLVRRYPQ